MNRFWEKCKKPYFWAFLARLGVRYGCGGDPNMVKIYLIFKIHFVLIIPPGKIKIALTVFDKIPKTAILRIFGNFERAQYANKNFR